MDEVGRARSRAISVNLHNSLKKMQQLFPDVKEDVLLTAFDLVLTHASFVVF